MALQIVIDEYGIYVTRSGRLVFIEKTRQGPMGLLYVGYILAAAKGGARNEWGAWAPDGRSNSSDEACDIVAKV